MSIQSVFNLLVLFGKRRLIHFFLMPLMFFYSASAFSAEKPVITLSIGGINDCLTAYIIEIFDDGLVRYKGVNKVKVYGYVETRINKKTLGELIKKIDNENFMNIEESMIEYIYWSNKRAIRIRKGEKENTVRHHYSVLSKIIPEIISAVGAKQWIYPEDSCYEK